MTQLRGLWEFVDIEPPEGMTIRPLFACYEFATDLAAKQAWEAGERAAKGLSISLWRFREPVDPPHKHFICLVMGEDEKRVRKVERALLRFAARPYEMDRQAVRAFALRRYGMALTGQTKERIRSPSGRVLHPSGHIEPYRRPQG